MQEIAFRTPTVEPVAGHEAEGSPAAMRAYLPGMIEENGLTAACEAAGLGFGRHIAVDRRHVTSLGEIDTLAQRLDEGRGVALTET